MNIDEYNAFKIKKNRFHLSVLLQGEYSWDERDEIVSRTRQRAEYNKPYKLSN